VRDGVTPARLAVSAAGAAVWVAGILLLDGQAATMVFAVAFALALPAVLHVADGGLAERRRTLGLAVFLLVMLPLAVLVFDEADDLALLVPAAIAAGVVVALLNRGDRPPRRAR
jgi:hypothetical protein